MFLLLSRIDPMLFVMVFLQLEQKAIAELASTLYPQLYPCKTMVAVELGHFNIPAPLRRGTLSDSRPVFPNILAWHAKQQVCDWAFHASVTNVARNTWGNWSYALNIDDIDQQQNIQIQDGFVLKALMCLNHQEYPPYLLLLWNRIMVHARVAVASNECCWPVLWRASGESCTKKHSNTNFYAPCIAARWRNCMTLQKGKVSLASKNTTGTTVKLVPVPCLRFKKYPPLDLHHQLSPVSSTAWQAVFFGINSLGGSALPSAQQPTVHWSYWSMRCWRW